MSHALADGILFTDQYQLTMAQLYFDNGLHERQAQFEHFFRRYPNYGSHQAGYCIAAGLDWLLDWMQEARFTPDTLDVLRSHVGPDGTRLFGDDFLAWLAKNGSFEQLTIRAVPEGRVVHADTPVVTVSGPLAIGQILETALLNQLNFQTLIATKASRVAEAARRRPVLEFGLRRAPGTGGNAATRAALIGGADASSNVGVSHLLGVQARGTHAHSMVQAFMALGEGELAAFRAYATSYPDECLLLVDTIDTMGSGIPNAITVFDELRSKGREPVGIRLDSGDLAYLAVQAAKALNDADYPDVSIVLSSGLDELLIMQILSQIDLEAPRYGVDPARLIDRLMFGVGSKLASSEGQPYLDGVYKLMAIDDGTRMAPAIKISETTAKTQNPGKKDLYRVYDDRGRATADLMAIADQ
ncbi:MAG: nicotinate phosphoribosyltransferase, partial [Acidimicrobiales bacterium]